MDLVSLPEDTHFEILEHLIVDEILQLRLTCKMFYEFTSRRIVWHSINKRLLAARPSPHIASLLPSMTASELMQNALQIVALYRRWREPVIRPRRKRLIALKRRTYPARAMCVPGTDFILEVPQTGCIYLGTYQDNSPSFTLTQPFLRRGEPGHSLLSERLGIDEPFALSVALNEDCRLRWYPTGWVLVVPSIAMPDRTAYWFNIYDVQISPPSIVLRLTIFVDQPVQSYDIEDDLLVCYSGPIEQQEGILHRLFIKNDPFNSTNALCDCSVMRPISGDPHTRVAILSSCHVLLVNSSMRDIYQLAPVNQGNSDPPPSIYDLPVSVPVWTMSDVFETINNESAPPIISVSRDLGQCAIFSGHRVDILECSPSHPTFVFNTITHLIRDSGNATYTLNTLGHQRAFQGSHMAISVFDGGLEVCTFSLADRDDIIYRENGIGRVAVSRIPKFEIPGFDKAYMVADEEGARLCISMKEKLSSRTFLVIVDI